MTGCRSSRNIVCEIAVCLQFRQTIDTNILQSLLFSIIKQISTEQLCHLMPSLFIHSRLTHPLILFKTQGSTFAGGSSRSSSKSATIEMYVGNSSCYNESMSAGETLSSLSDKSEHFFTQEHHGMHHLEVRSCK